MSVEKIEYSKTLQIINAVLLAIIRAYPPHGEMKLSDGERLNEAKHVLFGIGKPRGNRPIDDHDKLIKIARDYIAVRGNPKIDSDWNLYWDDEDFKEVPSLRSLIAEQAGDLEGEQFESFERRLRRNFNENKDDLLREVYFSNDVEEGGLDAIISNLEEIFVPLGIRIDRYRKHRVGHKVI